MNIKLGWPPRDFMRQYPTPIWLEVQQNWEWWTKTLFTKTSNLRPASFWILKKICRFFWVFVSRHQPKKIRQSSFDAIFIFSSWLFICFCSTVRSLTCAVNPHKCNHPVVNPRLLTDQYLGTFTATCQPAWWLTGKFEQGKQIKLIIFAQR